MPLIWFCACAYLLFSAVSLLEAEVRVTPGAAPSPLHVAWAMLSFALTHPADALFRWATAPLRR